MTKENVLFGIIGLLLGLIVGFMATNYINRNSAETVAAAPVQTANAPITGQQQQLPQINNQVVRDQTQTGGKTGGAALPQVQEKLDRANNNPNDFAAQTEAGEMYYRIKGFDKAAQYYEKASRLKPDDYDTIVKIGNAYYDGGKFEQAEKWYLQALAKNPDDVNVRTDLGVTFVERANPDLDRAIQEFRGSLKRNPNHEQTLNNLAIALSRKGDTVGLQETLAQLEKINPNNLVLVKLRRGDLN
jgi:tetratricopeptide (TPR) repeat protein